MVRLIKGYFILFVIFFISAIVFSIWNFTQVDEATIKIHDKYIISDPGSKDNHVSVCYRIIDDTGEYFDCQTYSWNPTATERMWNKFEEGKIYQVEIRGIKNNYSVRTITDIK